MLWTSAAWILPENRWCLQQTADPIEKIIMCWLTVLSLSLITSLHERGGDADVIWELWSYVADQWAETLFSLTLFRVGALLLIHIAKRLQNPLAHCVGRVTRNPNRLQSKTIALTALLRVSTDQSDKALQTDLRLWVCYWLVSSCPAYIHSPFSGKHFN